MNEFMFELKDAVLEDLPRIVEIYNSTIASREVTADLEPVTVESKQQWFDSHSDLTRPLWVLRKTDSEEIIAWLSFESFHNRPAYNATAEISIYIDEAHRGQGVGTFLLEKALQVSKGLNIRSLVALIFGHNLPSLALFGKFGFQLWGVLPEIAELDGQQRDLCILGAKLQ